MTNREKLCSKCANRECTCRICRGITDSKCALSFLDGKCTFDENHNTCPGFQRRKTIDLNKGLVDISTILWYTYRRKEKMSNQTIIYGGTKKQVKKQKLCKHDWHGPSIDNISRFYKCLHCYCLLRNISEDDYYKELKIVL